MCGILGTINMDFDDTVLSLVQRRGPDGAGIVRLSSGYQRITLGHRRLAIVELSPAGDQPMRTEDGACSIIYNGEVYNHQTLRSELGTTSFKGHSDTETVLRYLQQYGIQGVQKFNGIFAFGFVDETKGKLYLARDPFGVKPLYYIHRNGTFVFASEIKPILRLVPDSLDLANLAEVLRLRYCPSPDTLFSNLRKVRPGHILEVDLSKPDLTVKEYPFLALPLKTNCTPFSEAVERYGELFEAAIERQLMSDIEVGILLSGGIDSALVAAYAQKHSPCRMKAFTVGFKERDGSADEIQDAEATARILGLDHDIVRIGFEDFLSSIRKCVQIVEEPLATTSMIPMYALSELAAGHVKVVLSGQGADESLGGYGRYQGELYRRFFPGFLSKMILPIMTFAGIKDDQIIRGLQAFGVTDIIKRFMSVYAVFDDESIAALTGLKDNLSEEKLRYFYDLLGCANLTHTAAQMMALDLRLNLPDDLLLYTDKITMHHSLECRVPMLDLDLVGFITSLPCSYRARLHRKKIIHKAFARKVLPPAIIHRKKKGFRSPTDLWFRKSTALRDLLLSPGSRFSSYFDLKAVDRVITEHEKGYDRERQIFLLLGINYWMEEYA